MVTEDDPEEHKLSKEPPGKNENNLSKEPPDKGGIGAQAPIDESLVTEEDPDEDLDELAKAKAWLLRRGLGEIVRQCTSSTDLMTWYDVLQTPGITGSHHRDLAMAVTMAFKA